MMQTIAELAKTIQPGRNGSRPFTSEDAATPCATRVTLDSLDASHHPLVAEAIEAARRWSSLKIAGRRNISLVLVAGPVMLPDGTLDQDRTGCGCGKTHIARAIQWASYTALEDGTPVAPAGRFYTAADLLDRLGNGERMPQIAPAATETIHGAVGGTPVVIVDDVGAEGVLAFVSKEAQQHEKQARYFQILNYCYEYQISVVVTANLTLPELAKHLGNRAWSRLQQMAPQGFMINMTGVVDYRRKSGGRGEYHGAIGE